MFSFLYNGSNAGMVIRKVDAPEPSKWAIAPISTVAIATSTTLPRESLTILLMIGLNNPVSCMMPKNRMANTNMMTTEMTEFIPSLKNSVISPKPNPAKSAPMNGTITKATIGLSFWVINSVTIISMTNKPITLSISLLLNNQIPLIIISNNSFTMPNNRKITMYYENTSASAFKTK